MADFKPQDHTFVICAYQENPYVEETLETLEAQTVLGNIILSTSTPSDYLEDICNRHGIEMVVNPHPHLAGDDWNYGYDHASTPLVTMAHQDDIYAPNYLEEFLRAINRYDNGEVSLVFSDYNELRNGQVVHDNQLLKIKRVMNKPLESKALNGSRFVKRRILSFGDPICCPSAMYVKPVAGNTIFDTTYKNSCDYKTFVDMASAPGRFVYIPEELMTHRIYEESATTRNLGENIRKREDQEILSSLWPAPIAAAINAFYAKSEKSNEL